jgi:hypothetical protein
MAAARKVLNMEDGGSAEVLKISDLKVDVEYQRDLRHDLVEQIAREYDIVKAGPILVSRRRNGTLWVVDGQHRMAGALQAGEEEIFAHVVEGLTVKTEAALRLARNDRRSDSTFEKFRTRLVMGDKKAEKMVEIAFQANTQINSAPNLHQGINAISSAEQLYDVDGTGVWFARVLKVINDAWGEVNAQTASAAMMKSIAWFIDRHLAEGEAKYPEFIARLEKAGAEDIRRKAVNQKAAMGGAMWLNHYRAMVEIWNFGRQEKSKLQWKTVGSMTTLGDDHSAAVAWGGRGQSNRSFGKGGGGNG